jgi:hypothetical protein
MVRSAARGVRLVVFTLLLCCIAPMGAFADAPTGGATYAPPPPPPPDPSTVPLGQPKPLVPGVQAVLLPDGTAAAPADAPPQVQNAIWAANTIQTLPYRYGGGHRSFISRRGYDCSGTVSFALGAAGLLKRPRDSSSFMRYGLPGKGAWITIYTNPGHAFVVIAGLRLDTSAAGDPSGLSGPRWRPNLRSTRGYKARHPVGL